MQLLDQGSPSAKHTENKFIGAKPGTMVQHTGLHYYILPGSHAMNPKYNQKQFSIACHEEIILLCSFSKQRVGARKDAQTNMEDYGGLNKHDPHRLTWSGTIRGMALLKEIFTWSGL